MVVLDEHMVDRWHKSERSISGYWHWAMYGNNCQSLKYVVKNRDSIVALFLLSGKQKIMLASKKKTANIWSAEKACPTS